MTNEELEQILLENAESSEEEFDEGFLLLVMGELAERSANPSRKRPEQAWQEFLQHYAPPEIAPKKVIEIGKPGSLRAARSAFRECLENQKISGRWLPEISTAFFRQMLGLSLLLG